MDYNNVDGLYNFAIILSHTHSGDKVIRGIQSPRESYAGSV